MLSNNILDLLSQYILNPYYSLNVYDSENCPKHLYPQAKRTILPLKCIHITNISILDIKIVQERYYTYSKPQK